MAGVGDLVATLVADTKQWQSGLSEAKSELGNFARTAATSLAGIAASFASVGFAKDAIGAAESDIAATRKLEAVLTASGNAAGVTSEEIGQLASNLQRLTNFEDDATVGASALLASLKNVRGDNFKLAVRLAQDMATVLDVDLMGATKRLSKQLKDLSPEEVGHKLREMATQYGGAAEHAASATKQIELAWGDVKEAIGKELLPSVEMAKDLIVPLSGQTSEWMSTFINLAAPAKAGIDTILTSLNLVKDKMTELKPVAEDIIVTFGKPAQGGPEAVLGDPSAPLFENGKDDSFKRRMEDMRTEIDLFRGDITHAEAEFRRAIAAGFSEEQAKEIEEKVRLLDGLKQMQDDQNAAADKAKNKPDVMRDMKIGALEKGGPQALSAIYAAMNGGKGGADAAVDAAMENVDQNDVMIGLLRDIKDNGVAPIVVRAFA